MLVFATQMHIVTFVFVCIEILILFYLIIDWFARPEDPTGVLNIILITLLIIYNVTGGLLPDPKLPGSYFVQESIAYATGFITPCYFPYYVYKAFDLKKMHFHAYRGVYYFLLLPYLIFVAAFAWSGSLDLAKNLLILPVLYSVWVIISLWKSIRFKYHYDLNSNNAKQEMVVLLFSIAPWISLPFIAYFDLSQAMEASITNGGFLTLLALQMKRNVRQIKSVRQQLLDSELRLLGWSDRLEQEVDKRTKELERISEQKSHTLASLAHETKTPLTLINNYLEEYIETKGGSEELNVIKRSIDKLTTDMLNLLDLEKFQKGFAVYNHELVSDFSGIVWDNLVLFQVYGDRRNITIQSAIEENIFIKADPISLIRIVNNLIENAIKFSPDGGLIIVSLQVKDEKIYFSVSDEGTGIPGSMQKKIFDPYFQIAGPKKNIQGMGLGLSIVKKIVDELQGEIKVASSQGKPGTKMGVVLQKHLLQTNEVITVAAPSHPVAEAITTLAVNEQKHDPGKLTVMIVEDNIAMVNYLLFKLGKNYNVYAALNGHEAIEQLKNLSTLPELIISDVMMEKVDGYGFAKILSQNPLYHHIPFIFLTAKAAPDERLEGLKLGAIDFIRKPFSIHELLHKIQSILSNADKQRNAALFSAIKVLGKQAQSLVPDAFEQQCKTYQLTTREIEIARLICKGQTHRAIGETLFIAERTVAKHVQNIFEKVHVSSKMELSRKLEA